MAYKQLDLLLGRQETAFGTEVGLSATSPDSLFSASDFCQVADGFSLDLVQETTPQKFATGLFDQHASVPGTISAEVKIKTYLQSAGGGGEVAESFAKYLSACGMRLTMAPSTVNIYFPSSNYSTDWKSMTFHKYSGDITSSGSYRTKCFGTMFDGTIKAEVGKPIELDLTGKGAVSGVAETGLLYAGLPELVTYPTGPFTQLSDTNPAVLNASSILILGQSFRMLSFDFEFHNKVELVKDMSAAYGFAYATITDREAKWKAKVYESPYSTTYNPWVELNTQALSQLTVTIPVASGFGISLQTSTGANIEYPTTGLYAQVTSIKPGNANGINTWDLEGLIVGNNFAIVCGM
jgi:hypothetical protein